MMRLPLPDADATARLGAALAGLLRRYPGWVIHLQGDLGAGKTTLARGLLRELGVTGAIRSPTYTLMEPYEHEGGRLIHMDLYRLRSPAELDNLGLDDFPPGQVAWLVEWPERGGARMPQPDIRVQLSHSNQTRIAAITSNHGEELTAACKVLL